MMQFYYNPMSSPCRAVMLLMHALNIQPEMKLLDLGKGEHMSPEYLKMNPQHTIPLIVDNGFVLSESRAILGYLAEKYAMSMALYPTDPMARGVVNQRLFFDQGTLYQRVLDTYLIPAFSGAGKLDTKEQDKLKEALGWLETFLGDAPYMAGDRLTIADFALTATISSIDATGMDLSPYPKIWAWFMKMKKEMKDYEKANGEGVKMWGGMVKNGLNLK